MVAAMIDRLETGQSFDTLPAHMTVLPWFDLASNEWPDLHDELEDVAALRPQCVADTNFMFPLRDGICHHAIHATCRED